MAYQILYDILDEIHESGEQDRIQEVTSLLGIGDPHSWQSQMNVMNWIEEQLDLMNIPLGMFRQGYLDGLKPRHGTYDDGELWHIVEHIKLMIPEEEESEESDDEDDWESVTHEEWEETDHLFGDHPHLQGFKSRVLKTGRWRTAYIQTPRTGYFLKWFALNNGDPKKGTTELYEATPHPSCGFTIKVIRNADLCFDGAIEGKKVRVVRD